MDVVAGTGGATAYLTGATGNSGDMFYLTDDGATAASDAASISFGNSNLTGQRWEFFNADEESDILILFQGGVTVNGLVMGSSVATHVLPNEHATVMCVGTGQYIVWISQQPLP